MTERWAADAASIERAAARLRAGAVIAFPTDTLYAVGARASDAGAVQRLYGAKRRPATQPLILLVSGSAQIGGLATVSAEAEALMRRFWPGSLTLVLPARGGHPGQTVAFRAPDHPVAMSLLKTLAEPIASSSANPAGMPPPVDAGAVLDCLGGAIELVIDGGSCPVGLPSTILDLSGATPRILRQGAIPQADLLRR